MNAAPNFQPKPITKGEMDRLPPHSIENEEALLASLMAGCDVRSALLEGLAPEHFYVVRNGWIFEAICELFERNSDGELDTIMVEERLRERGQFDEVGGLEYLTYLTMIPGLGYTVRAYAITIRQKAIRRAMLNHAGDLAMMAYDESVDSGVQLDRHERGIKALKPFDPHREFVLGEDSHKIHASMLREQADRQVWHPMPFKALADRAPVVMDGDLVVIVGPEGSGKSALLMNWAESEARGGTKTVYIPTEMNRKTVFDRRVVANRKTVPFKRLQKPEDLTDNDWLELELAGLDLGQTTLPFLQYWFAGTVEESKLFAGMQRLVDDYGIRTFVIDYLNDVIPSKDRGQNESSAWRHLLARFEEFNRQNDSLIITAAQLNQDGNAYQIGRALRQKAMLFVKLKPKELEHVLEFQYQDVPYQYLPGDFNPRVRCTIEKYRGGGRGSFELLFVGPRYLWIDVPEGFDDGQDDPGAYDNGHIGRGAKD